MQRVLLLKEIYLVAVSKKTVEKWMVNMEENCSGWNNTQRSSKITFWS